MLPRSADGRNKVGLARKHGRAERWLELGVGGNCVKHGGVSPLLSSLPVLSPQTSTNLGLKSAWAQLKAYRVASKQTKEDDSIFTHSQAL